MDIPSVAKKKVQTKDIFCEHYDYNENAFDSSSSVVWTYETSSFLEGQDFILLIFCLLSRLIDRRAANPNKKLFLFRWKEITRLVTISPLPFLSQFIFFPEGEKEESGEKGEQRRIDVVWPKVEIQCLSTLTSVSANFARYAATLCPRHFQTIALLFLWPLTTTLEENLTALLKICVAENAKTEKSSYPF